MRTYVHVAAVEMADEEETALLKLKERLNQATLSSDVSVYTHMYVCVCVHVYRFMFVVCSYYTCTYVYV